MSKPRRLRQESRDRRDNLFTFLAAPGKTATISELAVELDSTVKQVRVAINDLRHFLGADRDINLICEPDGFRKEWGYRLVGTYEGILWWATNRVGDMESRLATVASVAESIVLATNGNSKAGQKARKIERTMTYLSKELAAIDLGDGD